MTIAIVDYGMGNPGSISNMINKVGRLAIITSDPDEISSASYIILPGVGSFDNAVLKLQNTGIWDAIHESVFNSNAKFLGICLGMQLLLNGSEEGKLAGLGWVDGYVRKFDLQEHSRLKVPHMGWNVVNPTAKQSLFGDANEELRYYFVHSYHAQCENIADVLATTNYGYEFTSAVGQENIMGVQFHPEKSHRFGLQLFKNFLS